MDQVVTEVGESSGVAEARRAAVALVGPLKWSEASASRLALAVTEAASNLVKHAGGGQVIARPIAAGSATGVEVLAVDHGPGIANIGHSMRDGQSTTGSPGLGLGSMARLSVNFEVYSLRGKGTALRFEIWAEAGSPHAAQRIEFGVVSAARHGETACGDAWALHSGRDRHVVMVVDGLGHGPEAATAAHVATRTLAEHPGRDIEQQMAALHDALRPTRGAAASLASITPLKETGSFCGVGNVAGLARVNGRTRSLVSHNGTLGHQLRKVQAFDFPLPYDGLLVLHSDGIATSWSFDEYPGIEARHPALVAAVLFRDHQRARDDATVVAVRNRQRRP